MLLLPLLFACNENPSQPENCVEADREVVTDQNTLSVVEGNQRFAFDIYAQLNQAAESNLFISPHSISTAFGMLQLGAEGETASELAAVFHALDEEQSWHAGLGTLSQELSLIDNCNYQLNTANRAYIQTGFGFDQSYLDGLVSFYNSQAEEVDFSAQPEMARQNINQWVSDQTMEKIPDLFPQNSINSNTRLVLTNAIYMNAPWTEAFDPAHTYSTSFYLADGQTTSVDMMSLSEANVSINPQETFQIVEIPYKGEDLSLTVLLPREADGLAAVEDQLSFDSWKEWKSNMYPTSGYLGIPKMELRYKKELKETLKEMGVVQAFEQGYADFSGIAQDADLFVTTVLHEAWLKFSEEGTEAAAATGVAVGTESDAGDYVVLDRPFIFVIEDTLTGSILFMGKVTDPSQL